jgi:hypothetical protein
VKPTRRHLLRVAGVIFSAIAVVGCFLVARRLTTSSWPLAGARLGIVAIAAGAYLASFGFRALGWQRLFPVGQRPDGSRCLAACGAAAASGAVLPFRLDYAVKVSTLRRLGGVRVGLDAIALSIIALGIVDAVAMLPLATVALATSGTLFLAPLIVVQLFCISCAAILLAGPRLLRLPVVQRSRRLSAIGRRVGQRAISRSTCLAGAFLLGCWVMRATGNTILLAALGVGFSPKVALVIVCLSAAASIVPITAGGAIVSIGTTSAILVGLGVSGERAVNFSLSSGMLLTGSALIAALVGVTGSMVLTVRRRHAGLALG